MLKRTRNVRTWLETSRKNARSNYAFFRHLIGRKTRLMAVVKSNAYGHGLVDFSRTLQTFGVDWFGVDSVIEGLRLRSRGIRKPILVLGYTLPENFGKAARKNISLTVSTLEGLSFAKSSGVRFHLKVDSGMHRQGFLLEEMPRVIETIRKLKISKSQFEGLYTHLAAPANEQFDRETKRQLVNFRKAAELVRTAGYWPLLHAAATGGTLQYKDARFDMVRIGIGLYGLWPAAKFRARKRNPKALKPVLSWKSRISEIKKIPKGERVGYDFTKRLKRQTRTAICPIGYWHGYPRLLSNSGEVLVGGRRARVLGRVSMDMLVLDITEIPDAKVGSEVVLIGVQGRECISAEELARKTRTSAYEILTRLNPLIQKVFV